MLNAELQIISAGASNNVVRGNFIGTTPMGDALSVQPANGHGIRIDNAPNNTIGGPTAGARNVISGNQFEVIINGTNAVGTVVQGNFVGTDATGRNAVPNALGIYISSGASGSLIGGITSGARNVISGNNQDGISVSDASANTIQGNFIGTDATGKLALGNSTTNNQTSGVSIAAIFQTATNNLVGGAVAGAGNLISGNNYAGVTIVGLATGNQIQGNFIGVDVTGQAPLGNLQDGVLFLGAVSNLIGGTTTGAGNVISANGGPGIHLAGTFGAFGASSSNNIIVGNYIGTPAPSTLKLQIETRNSMNLRVEGPLSPPDLEQFLNRDIGAFARAYGIFLGATLSC